MNASAARRVIVTGAASGIGLETALQLAQLGDHVVIADRNQPGGEAVVKRITDSGGSAEVRALDLASLQDIRRFSADELARNLPLDVLINNAGLLPPKDRATTRDGFELEFGIAHLGHFALTGLLLPALLRSTRPARVVSVSSLSHKNGRIAFDDLQQERRYLASRVYTATKLACLMFALELDRRARAAGSSMLSVAAHPGVARTPIAAGWESENRRRLVDRFELIGYRAYMRVFGQSAAEGARPIVHAASAPGVRAGGYYGPTGFHQASGPPGEVATSRGARDEASAARLWDASVVLTGVAFDALAARH